MSPMENWNADEPPAVDPDYVEEPTAADVELADVEEIADDEVPKLLDEADEIAAGAHEGGPHSRHCCCQRRSLCKTH